MFARTLAAFALLFVSAGTRQPVPFAHQAADPLTWVIDKTHSELTFSIRHLIGRVSGTFTDWSGTIVADPKNLSQGSVDVTINTASVTTNNEKRDNDLRTNEALLSADKFPAMTFKSTKVEQKGDALKVYGNLTIRDVTKPVALEGRLLGLLPAAGSRRATMAFEASTTINRLDYGVRWNKAVETGGVLLGDDVTIRITIEAVQQRPAAAAAQ
jgi:polyisoprenoid-binding protein YceI